MISGTLMCMIFFLLCGHWTLFSFYVTQSEVDIR